MFSFTTDNFEITSKGPIFYKSEFECFSIEAAFSSHVITLFIYDANLDTSISIFEMFLVFGSQVILDVLAFMVICTESKMLKLE